MSATFARSRRSLFRNERGGALVEFALLTPFLIFLLIGVIDLGRYMAYSLIIGNAVRAGAQVGAADGTAGAYATPFPTYPNNTVDYASSQAACNDSGFTCVAAGGTAPENELSVTTTHFCTYSGGSQNASCPSGTNRQMFIEVSASGTFKTLIHYPGLPDDVPMSATAIVQVGE